ncbi:hypothetical protein HUN08_00455 [Gordonia sp. X0973]|uniref:hypothetical protein n=1 Tax=Gordonia sp. X0973 TaxID=2742602 RepID=UPI000F529B48|nr:hypothetical protein [Gordonia sp. X0973]QKT05836.1 hypothetical protein HUN08_00455 [Gordonia sp. X0973]
MKLGALVLSSVAVASVVAAPFADAAPLPEARVCAVWAGNGAPFVGPVTVSTPQLFGPSFTLNTSPRGCMIFKHLKPHETYHATVTFSTGGTGTGADGMMGSPPSSVVYSTPWRRAPKTGQFSLGKIRIG